MSKGTAFVTGAANGIGRAIALRLADDGYDVAVNDLPKNKDTLDVVVKHIQEKGRKSVAALGDVSSESDVEGVIKQVVKELDSLDVMVANAGIAMKAPIIKTSVEQWDRLFSINVRGTFLCFKHAAIQMIAQGRGGVMLAACSIASKKGIPDTALYSSTKFAVRGLVQSAAMEYAQYNIRVNGYAPGAIETELLGVMDEYEAKKRGLNPGEWTKALEGAAALGRNGTPEDVAGLASFLVSKDSSFITGIFQYYISVLVDGGMLFD
ncbi:acetoin reductase family protein [Cyathus striatus]|nr:acetoin reductase family protein [Cyathus striatus]